MNSRPAGLAALAVIVLASAAPIARAQSQFQEDTGTLPDGTIYRMRLPANWNKVLISDLDFAAIRGGPGYETAPGKIAADGDRYMFLLERGYAISGTARGPRRQFDYDPAREIADLLMVIDRFEAKFGKPNYVIEYGQSGGGWVSLAMAETRPDRVNGVVAGCGHIPVWLANTFTDGWFVLQALLAPNLQIANLSEDVKSVSAEWRKVFETAQQTPQGRARMSLAAVAGQWPIWSGEGNPKPDLNDPESVEKSIYQMLLLESAQVGGAGRFMFEHAGGGQPASNVGTDYKKLFDNVAESNKRAVHALYKKAGLDLNSDLEKVNAAPRIAASQSALEWWSAVPGRAPTGAPKVPVLRLHTTGDLAVPISLLQGYEAKARSNGNDLYRQAIVDAPAHCAFTPGESTAAIETVLNRVKTGTWNTDVEQLNKLGDSFGKGKSRFIKFKEERYNHPWFLSRQLRSSTN